MWFVENVESDLQRKTTTPGHPLNGSMSLIFFYTYAHWWICMYRDVSLTSQIHAEVRTKSSWQADPSCEGLHRSNEPTMSF